MLKINTHLIGDKSTRDALESLVSGLNDLPLLKGNWQFCEVRAKGNNPSLRVPHALNFLPIDAFFTRVESTGEVSFKFKEFTKNHAVLSISGAGPDEISVIRFYLGEAIR